MLLNLTKTKFMVGTSSGIFSNTKPTFKSSLPHKKDDQEHLTTADPSQWAHLWAYFPVQRRRLKAAYLTKKMTRSMVTTAGPSQIRFIVGTSSGSFTNRGEQPWPSTIPEKVRPIPVLRIRIRGIRIILPDQDAHFFLGYVYEAGLNYANFQSGTASFEAK